VKSGSGRGTVYSVSGINKISLPVNVKEYFDIPYFQREVKESFNFEIFNILSNDIFTTEEKEKLENESELIVLAGQITEKYDRFERQYLISLIK